MKKKQCSKCGKDLNRENLDFTKEIICDSCLSGCHRERNLKQEDITQETEISVVKKLYDAIKKREIVSVAAIECLERVTKHNFTSTKDFQKKMEQFLAKHYYKGADFRRARKWRGMDQLELAEWLGASRHRIKQMETNKKPLSQDAIDFIMVMGFKKTIPLKKSSKKASEPNCTHNPKINKTSPEKKPSNPQVSDLIDPSSIKQFTKEEAFPLFVPE